MRSIKLFLLFPAFFMVNLLSSQTVVKMDLPAQADDVLKVVALFNEELPEGIPVVLGLMGYNVEGGMAPYLFEWVLNGEVISSSDIAIFTPEKGDELSLKVTDNNKCRATSSFNLKVASVPRNLQVDVKDIKIFPTVFTHEISVQFPENEQIMTLVRIYDTYGKMVYNKYLPKSTDISLNLNSGTYFISVRTAEVHKVEKIIAQ
jgi:hypothetical protein